MLKKWISLLKSLVRSRTQISEEWLKQYDRTHDGRNTFDGVSWEWPVKKAQKEKT
jgi:hypothetical protein